MQNIRLPEQSVESDSEISRFWNYQTENVKQHGEYSQYFVITVNGK